MLSVTSKSYYFPNNSDSISDDEVGLAYFDEIKNFFVETLGFYVIGERKTYTNGSSIAYCYFFSDQQNGRPIFCINTVSTTSITSRYSRFVLQPCSFNDIEYFPYNSVITDAEMVKGTELETQGIVFSTKFQPYAISFFRRGISSASAVDMRNNNIIVQDVKFLDGRRILFFKTQRKSDHEWLGAHNWGAIFFTDIVFKNNIIRDWVFFGVGLGGSYNPFFEQYIVNRNIAGNGSNFINLQRILPIYHGYAQTGYTNPRSISSATGGLIPNIYSGKDYLILQDFYIGNEAYIPKIYRYSNISSMQMTNDKRNFIVTNKGKMGDYVTIKNNNYLIIYNGFLYNSADWYGYDVSTAGDGTHGDKGIDSYGLLRTINTESLMISI